MVKEKERLNHLFDFEIETHLPKIKRVAKAHWSSVIQVPLGPTDQFNLMFLVSQLSNPKSPTNTHIYI